MKGFTIYGRGGHLGHVASIILSDVHFLVPESLHTKMVHIGTVVSDKSGLNFCMYTTLGQCQEMTLTFNNSHTFIYSIICLPLPTFRSLAAIVSEKSTVFTFSHRKA